MPHIDLGPIRRGVEMRAYAVRSDNSILDLRVTNLSYDGCAIDTDVALTPGERINLSVLGRGVAKATVRWYDNRQAGLLFDTDPRTPDQYGRAAERLDVTAEISLRRASRRHYQVRTADLTRLGCKCEFVDRPGMKERVWVKFPALEAIEAIVRRLEGSNAGLEFVHPIHPAVFDMLVDRLRATEPPPL
ncbi:MAG: PilZ domain-containing protein [Sphingomicrobium sp.]